MAKHRHQRHEARSAADEEQRTPPCRVPGEVAADRPAQLELVAREHVLRQVRRHLAVLDQLDRQLETSFLRRRGDRIRALGLVAVLGGQADVDVLPGAVAGPALHVEHERLGVGVSARISETVAMRQQARLVRGQSLQYRCSLQGSP